MYAGANLDCDIEKVANIIRDAGGEVVGRTRLQKISFFLELAGLGEGFSFEYRHYGPYSEDLAVAARAASMYGMVHERECAATWGGYYSVYSVDSSDKTASPRERVELVRYASKANPVELELAATAAFLAVEGYADCWKETANRKPDKVKEGHLEGAKKLYRELMGIRTPNRLPQIL